MPEAEHSSAPIVSHEILEAQLLRRNRCSSSYSPAKRPTHPYLLGKRGAIRQIIEHEGEFASLAVCYAVRLQMICRQELHVL